MDGGDHGGYSAGNDGYGSSHYDNNNNPAPPIPLITAIDKFLQDSTQTQNHDRIINESSTSLNVVSNNIPFLNDGINNENQMCVTPYLSTHVDNNNNNKDVFSNIIGECLSCDELESYPKCGRIQQKKPENGSGCGKKTKGDNISNRVLGKVHWTEEEDSKLIRLVEKHGDRNWALIGDKMTGRVGKQCRERWRNQLQPDIKKDSWSEQELRILVEAHKKLGNKWVEIEKLIPGRTENSVKNIWNAAKRKISSRKNKIYNSKNRKSESCTLLQDYIRSITNDHTDLPSASSSSTATNTSTTTTKSPNVVAELANLNNYESDPSLEITHSLDDEMNFMQTFFSTTNKTSSNVSYGHVVEPNSAASNIPSWFCTFSSCYHDHTDSNMFLNNYPEDDIPI